MADYRDSTFTFQGPFEAVRDIANALAIGPSCDSCNELLETLAPPPAHIMRLDALDALNRQCDRKYPLETWKEKHWGADREIHPDLVITTNLFNHPAPDWGELSITISTAWATPDEAPITISKNRPTVTVSYISDTMAYVLMDEIMYGNGQQLHRGIFIS